VGMEEEEVVLVMTLVIVGVGVGDTTTRMISRRPKRAAMPLNKAVVLPGHPGLDLQSKLYKTKKWTGLCKARLD
jgi:hypothetical protein